MPEMDLGRRLLDLLRHNLLVPDIRDELFPKRSVRHARDMIVRMAERPEFAAAICSTWGNDVGAAGVSAWRSWCDSRRTSRDRLRSLRRLVRLCDDVHAFISGDAM
jgi:L-fucose isomerase-like protein